MVYGARACQPRRCPLVDHTDVLYWEVNSACETMERLVETPTGDRKRIAALALSFVETVGYMKGHEVNEGTGRRECADQACNCPMDYAAGGPSILVERLAEMGDVLDDTGFFFEPGANDSPLAGAQLRRWYEQDWPGFVETLRKHVSAITYLAGTGTGDGS